MMSISVIQSSAKQAADYYMNEEKNYYLAEKGLENSAIWHGKGADKNDLLGKAVNQKDLQSILSGVGKDQAVYATNGHRPGWDLTFSAPKSVSIMALVKGDERFIKIHDQAVKTVLNQIEKDTAQVRVKQGGEISFHNTQNLTFATIRHATSRAMEPQLHTHGLTANMSFDEQNKLKALASSSIQHNDIINGTFERIYNNQLMYGMMYQSEVAKAVQNLGFAIEPTGNGQFEIKGMGEAIKKFSTRSDEIEAKIQELGIDTPQAREYAAKMTRDKKTLASMETLKTHWKEILGETKVVPEMQDAQYTTPKVDAKEAVQRTVSHLNQYHTSLAYEKLMTLSLKQFAIGNHLSFADMQKAINTMIEKGALIPLNNNQSKLASQAMLDKEIQLMDLAGKRFQNLSSSPSKEALSELKLTEENKHKVTALFESTKQLHKVDLSGSSKQIIESLVHVAENSNQHIKILSPSALEHQCTKESTTRQSHNILQWLKNNFKEEYADTVHRFLYQSEQQAEKAKLRQKQSPLQQFFNPTPKTADVVVVDQAQKLSVDALTKLMETTQKDHSKLVLLNHDKGLAFNAGNPMETLDKAKVNKIAYHSNRYSDAVVVIHENQLPKDKVPTDPAVIYKEAIKDFAQSHGLQSQQLLTQSNKDALAMNHAIRDSLKQAGKLGRVEHTFNNIAPVYLSDAEKAVVKNYKKGMEITFFDPNNKTSAQAYDIKDINKASNTLTLIAQNSKNKQKSPLHWNPIKETNAYKVATQSTMAVSVGEQLRATGNMRHIGWRNGERLTVNSIDKRTITLNNHQGRSIRVNKTDLDGSSFQYNYAKVVNQADQVAKSYYCAKSYAANSHTLAAITQKSAHVACYTDHANKLKTTFEKAPIQPTSLSVLQKGVKNIGIDKVLSSDNRLLREDIRQLAQAINQKLDKDVLTASLEHAIAHVNEKEAGFRHESIVKEALLYALQEKGQAITRAEIDQKMAEIKAKGQALSAEYSDGTRWGTKTSLETEKRILEALSSTQGLVQPFLSPFAASKKLNDLAVNDKLTTSQKDAIHLMVTTSSPMIAIQGVAGTGKSTMLQHAETLIKHTQKVLDGETSQKSQFIGLAPTHAAVKELQSKNIPSQTLQSLLVNINKGKVDKTQQTNKIYLLDEFSFVGNNNLMQFVEFVKETGARAVILGDKGQLSSQSGGKPTELAIQRGVIETAYLTDIVRQKNAPGGILKAAVEQIADKNIKPSLSAIQEQPLFSHYRKVAPNKDKSEQTKIIEILKSANIVETYQKISDNEKLNRSIAKENVIKYGSEEYLSRTANSRRQTLFILYGNKDRDQFADVVRAGLKNQKALDENDAYIPRLREKSRTDAQKRLLHHYDRNDIVTIGKEKYYQIDTIDKASKSLLLKDIESGKTLYFEPQKVDHQMTRIWEHENKAITKGDHIMLRHDKNQYKSNTEFKVAGVNDTTGEVTLKNKKDTLTLDANNLKDMHWDYAYAKTSDMAQGATYTYSLPMIKSTDNLTNIKRFYVDVSRAKYHTKVITDNVERLALQIHNVTGNKFAALDTVEKKEYPETKYFEGKAIDQGKTVWDESKLNRAFVNNRGFQALYGEPLTQEKNKLAWTDLSVSLDKQNYGKAYDHYHKRNLNAVDVVQQAYRGISKEQAYGFTCDMAGIEADKVSHQELSEAGQKDNNITSAQSIYAGTTDIKDTLGERYLNETRGISKETIARSEVKFWEPGTRWVNTDEKGGLEIQENKTPALVVPMINAKGEVTAVQRTYLDHKKPEKNSFFNNAKLSKGSMSGSAGLIQAGTDKQVFIAEGAETALSLANVNPDSTVLASFSVSNLNNMGEMLKPYKYNDIVIAGDNDGIGSMSYQLTEKAVENLQDQGFNVTSMYPEPLTDQAKTDFNDVHQELGSRGLSEQLDRLMSASDSLSDLIKDKIIDKIEQSENTAQINEVTEKLSKTIEAVHLHQIDIKTVENVLDKSTDLGDISDRLSNVLEDNKLIEQDKDDVFDDQKMPNIELRI